MTNYQKAKMCAKGRSSEVTGLEWEYFGVRIRNCGYAETVIFKDEKGIWRDTDWHSWENINPYNVTPHRKLEEKLTKLNSK